MQLFEPFEPQLHPQSDGPSATPSSTERSKNYMV